MKKNQKGFSAVEGILIIIIVALLSGIGWYVYSSSNKANKSYDNANKSSSVTTKSSVKKEPEKTDETAAWASFTPNSKLYTIKLPDGWTFLHQNDDCDCLYSQNLDFKKGNPAVIEKTQGGRDGIFGYFIVADEKDESGDRFQSFRKQGTMKAGELEGTKYYYEQTDEPDGLGLEKGGKEYAYYFIKDGKGIYISYSINPGETDNLELVEKSVKTLR